MYGNNNSDKSCEMGRIEKKQHINSTCKTNRELMLQIHIQFNRYSSKPMCTYNEKNTKICSVIKLGMKSS